MESGERKEKMEGGKLKIEAVNNLQSSRDNLQSQTMKVGVYGRTAGGPIEVAKGVLSGQPGFNPPEPTLLYATDNWYKPENVELLRDAHIKQVSVTFSCGFSIETENLQRNLLQEYIAECHRHGIQVEARMSLTNIFCDDMYAKTPRSQNWIAKDASGEPLTDGTSSFDSAGRTIRYLACLLHPEWRQYLQDRIDLAIDAGADVIVYDDVIYQCDCPRCREEFHQWREALIGAPDLESDLAAVLSVGGKRVAPSLLIVEKEVSQAILNRHRDEIFRWVADGAYLFCLDIDYPRGIAPNFFPYQVQFTGANTKEITFADSAHPLVSGWRGETFYVESEVGAKQAATLLLGSNAIARYGEQWTQLCSSQDKVYLLEAPYGNGKIAIAQFHKTFWNDSEMCMRMTDNIIQWAAKGLDKHKNVLVLDSPEHASTGILERFKDWGLEVELIAGKQAGDIKPFRRLVIQNLMCELIKHAHKRKPEMIIYADYHAGDYGCAKVQPVVSVADGLAPGYGEDTSANNNDDIESQQSRDERPCATNVGLLNYLRGLADGRKPVKIGYVLPYGRQLKPDKCQLALAEGAKFHANFSLPVEGEYLSRLFFDRTDETWQAIGGYNEFFQRNALYYRDTVSVSDIALLMDDECEQINLLDALSKNRFLYDVILAGQAKKSELKLYWALLALDAKYIDDETFAAVSDYINDGGTLITTRNSFLFDQFYRERNNVIRSRLLGDYSPMGSIHKKGEGMVICYPETPTLEQLVLEIEKIIGRQIVEIDAPDSVLYNVAWQKTQNQLVLHLINYSQKLTEEILVEVDAKVESIKLLSPDDVKREVKSVETYEDDVTRFVVPELLTYNLVLIKLSSM